MTSQPAPSVRVQADDFDVAHEQALLTQDRKDIGALVSFIGLCRDEDNTLEALELEHYPGMAEAEISRVAGEAIERWPLQGLTVIHRFGRIRPGEQIVFVLTAARHRADAFAAAEFLMDYLKTRAPFWKKEQRAGSAPGDWVSAKSEDDSAAERWR
ncbi:molybdenum cofactor biosynthesis protein MoaE [Methylocystis sp. B8]|uniref:molybdenum cofactor biosynthesis protein MoaE n=1 Tax=Methylocystis sp. B8 TaxID=544938 RepID=UPI0010FF0443|nr:molybdenum cofactor biosynthesis protein MoaE [Methylocystis sp. B8]TLG71588.1 molybdenum cofactor biosynthesis protein MoaE [Methylocystis sp. B8]